MPKTTTARAATARQPLDHQPAEMRRRRVAAGLRLIDVASAAGIGESHLSELERGLRNPSPPTLLKIATALGCSTEDLMAPARTEAA